ncbi:MAG: hypothetical protein ABFE13_11375 [Phycisphaerales bacterium]
MPRTVSEIRRIMEAEGTPWTPDLRAAALSGGAIDDSVDVNPGFVMGPTGMQFNPLAANVVAGATRGATAGFANPAMVGSTGDKALDLAGNVAGQVGELGGMAATASVLPSPAMPAGANLLARLLARAVPAGVKGAQYGLAGGVASGLREDLPVGELLKGAAVQSGKDALLFGGLAGIPSLPAKLGGAYGQSALIGAGMGMATGGPEGALAGALAFLLSHALTGPVFAGRTRAPEDPAVARATSERMALEALLREQYAEQQANEAFLELQSRKFEDLVPAKGEVQKRKTHEKTLAKSPAEMAAEAALELADRPEDARTKPNEGPKVPLFQGEKLYRAPVLNPEKAPTSEITPEEASAIAQSLTIPGAGRPGQRVVIPGQGGQRPGSIEVVPGGKGETIIVLRRPGSRAASPRHPEPLNTQEELGRAIVDETARTYKGGDVPLNPPPNAPMLKPGFLKTAEEKIANRGDIVLGTGAGGLEQIKQAFRRPGQKKVLRDETGERAVKAFATHGFFVDPAKAIDLVVRRPIRGEYRGSKAVDRYRSNEGRLDRMHRGASEVSARAREALAVRSQNVGRVSRILREAGADPKILTPQDRVALGHALRGTGSPAELSPRSAAAFRALDAYRKTPIARARNAGVEVGERENYFHQAQLTPQKLGNPKIRADVIENMMRTNPREYPTPETASKAIDAYVEVVKNRGRGNVQALAKKMVAKGQALSEEHAMVLIDRYSREREVGEFGGFKERQTDMPFYDPDPLRAFAKYIDGAETRIAEAAAFGPKGEKIDELIAEIKDPEVRKAAKFAWTAMRGTAAAEDPTGNMALRRIRRVMGLKLGPFTTMRNLGQPNNILLASDTKSFIEGLRRSRTAYGEKFAQDSGSKSETELRNLKEMQGGLDWWHEATGLLPSERFGRKWATNSGAIFAERRVAQLLKSEPGSQRHNGARRDLEMMDINPDTIIKQGGITHDQLRRAAFQFAHNTYFGYGAKDLPAKFNESEEWKTILQFKAYGVQQGRFLANSTIDELRAGRPGRFARNVAILMTVYPATGEVINDLIAAIQGRDRKNNLFVRYMEDATATGAVGVLMDTIQSARYGSLADFMAGPTLGTFAKMGKISYDAMAGQMTDTQKRFLMMQIPGIGQLFSYRVLPKKEKSSGTSRPGSSPPSKVPPKKVPKRQPIRQPDYLTKSS